MLRKGAVAKPEAIVSADEQVRDPFILEFLGLKDEYSETDLEEELLRHLESFLLELGSDFCLSVASDDSGSAVNGTASIFCFSIAGCAALS